MPDNTGPEENDVETTTTTEHTPVIWPEPSHLDSWWRDIMADPAAANRVGEPGTASSTLTSNT